MAKAAAGSRKRTPTAPGFVFYDVTWDDYKRMLRMVGDRPIRVIYDQGTMEIFVPTFGHDSDPHFKRMGPIKRGRPAVAFPV